MTDQAKPAKSTDPAAASAPFGELSLRLGEKVRSLRPVKNDGTYLHKRLGACLVQTGDVGYIRGRWSFLGRIYYTVEFVERGVVASMRGRELVTLVPRV
jgi:nitrogen fixation protein NifZ